MLAKAGPVDALFASAAAAAVLAIGLAVPAHAQSEAGTTTLPLERYRPAMDVRGLGTTEAAQVPAHLGWDLGLTFGYELNPLVLRDPNGTVVAPVVAHRVGADLLF